MRRSDWGERRHTLGGYREYAPPMELADIVEVVWTYDLPEAAEFASDRHRVLPESGLSLCFWSRGSPDDPAGDVAIIVIGPVRSVRVFAPEPGTRLEAVRIRPEWCRDFLDIDPSEHTDGLNRLRDIRPRGADRLLDAYTRSAGTDGGLRVLLRELLEMRDRFRPSRATTLASAALDSIRAARSTNIGFRALARELDVSERHLRRIVRQTTGSGPKRHHRFARLNRAMAAADRELRPNWSRLAVRFGFYDQSHLIREFRMLTGSSPVELHRERLREHQTVDGSLSGSAAR